MSAINLTTLQGQKNRGEKIVMLTCYDAGFVPLLEQAVVGVDSPASGGEPMHIDNTMHPANPRLALAKATGSMFNVFGIQLDDKSGTNNGHFAPFSWQGG